MSDFLQQLRSGNTKHYDRGRKHYDNPQYRGNERINGRDRKNTQQRKYSDHAQLNIIRKILETISENQKSMLESAKRRATAEERMAEALENVVDSLQKIIGQNALEQPLKEDAGEMLSAPAAPEQDTVESESPISNPRENLLKIIKSMRESGESFDKIARHLEAQNIPTLSGRGHWRGASVSRIFYQDVVQEQ